MPSSVFLDLPDDLLYNILTYVAPPTERVYFLCHRLIPLSSSIRHSINHARVDLWSMILTEYVYNKTLPFKKTTAQPKRSSKRLHRKTSKEEVQVKHRLLCDRTYIAFYALDEMVHSSKTPLSLKNLRWIFENYGPILRCNQYHNLQSKGSYKGMGDSCGTFLVLCCRARHCKESIILNCVKELIEKHGALPDVYDINGKSSTCMTTPLCIASARGFPSIVRYLIKAGASLHTKGTDSIAVLDRPHKRIHGTFTPYEFANKMHQHCSLNKKLKKCMIFLREAERAKRSK